MKDFLDLLPKAYFKKTFYSEWLLDSMTEKVPSQVPSLMNSNIAVFFTLLCAIYYRD